MIEKFKTFLAGAPYRFDEVLREEWIHRVTVDVPLVMCEWYDPDFKDIWDQGGAYYESAYHKLLVLRGFKNNYPSYHEIIRALKILVEFFDDEKRKSSRGTTTRKPQLAVPSCQSEQPELPVVEVLEEGELRELHISKCERNSEVRRQCLEYWCKTHGGRIICVACEMTFKERYGAIGEGYIEVHHLNPISQINGVHTVDPKTDLVPLCANCHAMIHRLMSAEKKATGHEIEGSLALQQLRGLIKERR